MSEHSWSTQPPRSEKARCSVWLLLLLSFSLGAFIGAVAISVLGQPAIRTITVAPATTPARPAGTPTPKKPEPGVTKNASASQAITGEDILIDSRGLVLHLTFDTPSNQAIDKSDCKNHGTLENAHCVEAGHIGRGCYLDGQDDYIRIANSNSLELLDALTLAVWVRLDSFDPGGYGNEEGHFLKKGDPLWWNPGYGLGYSKGSGYAKFVIGHPQKPIQGGGVDLGGKTALRIGRWHHVVGTYDGRMARLYIDGQLDGEKPYQGSIRNDHAPVMIGGGKLFSPDEFANHFAVMGTIDDVRVYNRALAADEVKRLFDVEGRLAIPTLRESGMDEF